MVKDLRCDPILKKGQKFFRPQDPLGKDLLLKYKETVDQTIAFRNRIMIFVVVAIHLVFNFLDRAVYPAQASFFFKMRMASSLLNLSIGIPCFFKRTQKYSIWVVDIITISFIAVICMMI